MIINCPHCGQTVTVHGLGRKRLNIPLKKVLESLSAHRSVVVAAQELNCREAYIFGVLKANKMKLKDIKRQGE